MVPKNVLLPPVEMERHSNGICFWPSGHRECEGVDTCDTRPKSAFSKNYYQQQLKKEYDWWVGEDFSFREMKYLYEIGWDLRLFFSNQSGGHGQS